MDELASAKTVVGEAPSMMSPQVSHTAQGLVDTTHEGPRAQSKRTLRLLLFGGVGLVVLLGMMFGLKVWLNKRKAARAAAAAKQPAVAPDELAARHFEEGTKQYRARNWAAARRHYLKVLAVAPGFTQAKRYADQAAAEMSARDALKRAGSALAAKDYQNARRELSRISSTSVYSADVRSLKQRVDDEQVRGLLESARLLRDSSDPEGALAKVRAARKISPTNSAVSALYDELTGSKRQGKAVTAARRLAMRRKGRRPRRRAPSRKTVNQPAPKPLRAGSGARAGLAHYRARQWGPAYQALKRQASSLSGRRKDNAERLAELVRKVAQALLRAQKVQVTQPAQAMRYYSEALGHDRKIPGRPQQRWIKGQLYKVARLRASAAAAAGRYTESYAAVRTARRYGKVDAALKKVLRSLERKAEELFTKGYTVRQSNPRSARRLWQRVLKMVPPSSPIYQKAYSWLNQGKPSYQDEDEE